jgi:hypothetical protein
MRGSNTVKAGGRGSKTVTPAMGQTGRGVLELTSLNRFQTGSYDRVLWPHTVGPEQWRSANKFRNGTRFCVTWKAKTASESPQASRRDQQVFRKNCPQLIRQYYSPFVTLIIHINYHCTVSQSNHPQVNKSDVSVHHHSSSFIAHWFAVVHMAVHKTTESNSVVFTFIFMLNEKK